MSSSTLAQQTRDEDRSKEYGRIMRRLHRGNSIATTILMLLAAIVMVIFIGVIVLLVVQGVAYIFNPSFYDPSANASASIAPELFNTVYILILSEILLVPIALAAAIYLSEYAQGGPLVTVIHFAAETLAGIPTLVLGLFGVIAFVLFFHLQITRLSGALTLLCLNLPVALRLFEQSLAAVPRELREGGLALGATKWRVIRTVVLPSALPGVVTGIILTAGRVIGETAALIFTTGTTNPRGVFTLNPLIPSDTLTIHLWYVKTQGAGAVGLSSAQATAVAAGSSTVLIIMLLVINLVARGLGRFIERRLTAA